MGIFSYTPLGTGKGVRKDGPQLRRPFQFFSLLFDNIWNFMKMNLLFLITCVPVITIGPSICALTYYSKCVTTETHMFLLTEYFEYFKKNFFKGILVALINIVPFMSLIAIYFNIGAVPHFSMLFLPVLLVNLIIIIMSFYVYPMLITYDLPLWAIYKNAFIFTMIRLPLNIFTLIVFFLIIAAACAIHLLLGNLLMPIIGYGLSIIVSVIFAGCILLSLLNYLTTFTVWPTIKKYMEE